MRVSSSTIIEWTPSTTSHLSRTARVLEIVQKSFGDATKKIKTEIAIIAGDLPKDDIEIDAAVKNITLTTEK